MNTLRRSFQLFTPDECDELIDLAEATGWRESRNSNDIRTNYVSWVEPPRWCKNRIWDMTAGRQNNTPECTWLQEPFQISRYEPGEFYDWHQDRMDIRAWHKSIRQLTVTATLGASPGGAVEIRDHGVFCETQGSAVIFRATDVHRATAPQGTRYAFTVWAMGPNQETGL